MVAPQRIFQLQSIPEPPAQSQGIGDFTPYIKALHNKLLLKRMNSELVPHPAYGRF